LFYIYVLKRPGVEEFLKKVGKLYEVVIYTASLSKYASPLVDLLDHNNVTFYKLFREHCTFYNNGYVKNLAELGRNLKDVIIVDNSPASYALQPENAIPIQTWTDDPKDTKLFELCHVLERIALEDDVRPAIKKIVKNGEIDYMQALEVLGTGRTAHSISFSKVVNAWSDQVNAKMNKKIVIEKSMKLKNDLIEEMLSNKARSRQNNCPTRHSQIEYEDSKEKKMSLCRRPATPKCSKEVKFEPFQERKKPNKKPIDPISEFEKIIQSQEMILANKFIPSTVKHSDQKENHPAKVSALFTNLLNAKKEKNGEQKGFGDHTKSPKPVKVIPFTQLNKKSETTDKKKKNRHCNSLEGDEVFDSIRKRLDLNSPVAAAMSHKPIANPFSNALSKRLVSSTPKSAKHPSNLYPETPKAKIQESTRVSLKTTNAKSTLEPRLKYNSIARVNYQTIKAKR